MMQPIIAIAGGLLLVGFIFFALRQGMKVRRMIARIEADIQLW